MIPQKREVHLRQLLKRLQLELQNLEQLSIALTHPSFYFRAGRQRTGQQSAAGIFGRCCGGFGGGPLSV